MKRQPPSRFKITGSITALPGIREAMAKSIYNTHVGAAQAVITRTTAKLPTILEWDNLTAGFAGYVRKQADAVVPVVDAYLAQCRRKRPPREPSLQDNPALIEDIPKAIYRTHQNTLPTWEQVTEDMREWNRQQSVSVARTFDDFIANYREE